MTIQRVTVLFVPDNRDWKKNFRCSLFELPKRDDRIFYDYPVKSDGNGNQVSSELHKQYYVDEVVPVLTNSGSDYIVYLREHY